MKVSETSQKIYDGIAKILKENGQPLSKAQAYAIESLVETVEESVCMIRIKPKRRECFLH